MAIIFINLIIVLVESSESFEEFLSFLGDTIKLDNWTGFRGGLDIKSKYYYYGYYYSVTIVISVLHFIIVEFSINCFRSSCTT